MTKTVILWDIDGTLLLTGGAGKVALNRAFEVLFNEQEIWQDIKAGGRTDSSLIRECYEKRFGKDPSDQEICAVAEKYSEFLPQELERAEKFRVLPHVSETLEWVSDQDGMVQGLATGNYETTGFSKLKKARIDHHFAFGGYSCDSEDRFELTKHAVEEAKQYLQADPKQIVLVGDTVYDIRCGQAIGAVTVAVCTGPHSVDVLEAENPNFVISDLSQFKNIINS